MGEFRGLLTLDTDVKQQQQQQKPQTNLWQLQVVSELCKM